MAYCKPASRGRARGRAGRAWDRPSRREVRRRSAQSPASGSRYWPRTTPPSPMICSASAWTSAGGDPSTSSAGRRPRESAFFFRRGRFLLFCRHVSRVNALGERRNAPHEPRVQGELRPVIPLLRDGRGCTHASLVPFLAVEALVVLPQRQLALGAKRLLGFPHLRAQQRDQLRLRLPLPRPLRVHPQQLRPGRAVQVGIGPREFAGRHHGHLENVLDLLAHRPHLGRGPEVHLPRGDVLDLFDDSRRARRARPRGSRRAWISILP